ncbi:MAG: replication initiation protein [Lactobacillus amylovorus]|nr:replication initiation protein [Lactobacillus amylovorus]
MANEIVKYGNRLNTIPLGRLNSNEMNLFITLVQQSYNHGTNELTLTFKDLQQLSRYDRHTSMFVKDLLNTNKKLLSINAWTDDGDTITQFACCEMFQIQRKKQILKVRVNPQFQKLFNDLDHWTRFQLRQFTEIKSVYAKNMFRLIKQYRTVGRLQLTKEELAAHLDLPKNYLKKSSNITSRVLNPIKEELTPLIRGFAITTVHGSGRGCPVVAYRFTWKPESKNADDFYKGAYAEQRKKLDNIDFNNGLTPQEKARAYDRILGLKRGTTDPGMWHGDESSGVDDTPAMAEKRLTQKEELAEFNDILKTWVQFFDRTDIRVTGKLKALLDEFGHDQVKFQVERYSSISGTLEPLKILELIEKSLLQAQ